MNALTIPKLNNLPVNVPVDGAVRIEQWQYVRLTVDHVVPSGVIVLNNVIINVLN